MHIIYYRLPNTGPMDYQYSLNVTSDIATARLLWDSLKDNDYYMVSARP